MTFQRKLAVVGFFSRVRPGRRPGGLSERGINFNKEALFVKLGETYDSGVSEKALRFLEVSKLLQESGPLVLPPPKLS